MLLNEAQRPTAVHYRILLMSWAGWLFDFYDLVLYTFLLLPIGREMGLSRIQLSSILGVSLAATALGGILFGVLADRWGRKTVLQWTILTFSLGTFLSGLAQNAAQLVIFRALTGLGVGGEWATGQTYIGETFPARMRGRFGGWMQTGAPLGVALASLVGGFLMPRIGWRACFLVSVAPALLVIWIRQSLPESDLWLARGDQRPKGFLHEWKVLWLGYRSLFGRALVLALFDMSAYWFTYAWLPGYLAEERHLSLARSAVWMLVTQGGGLLGYAIFGYIADHLGRRPAYSAYSLIWAIGLWTITLLWDRASGSSGVLLGCMFLVGFGTGMFGGFGPLFAELFPTAIRNSAMGAAFNAARGVQFFTPMIIAVVARRYGLGGGISLGAIFALLSGIWIWTFPETRGRRLA